MKTLNQIVLTITATTFLIHTSYGFVFTIEDPGVQSTTVANALTETFDGIPLGAVNNYSSPTVGGVYNGGAIAVADIYGGANNSHYLDIPHMGSASLVFDTPKTYFGMWWSAGDRYNELTFLDPQGDILGSYQVGDIIPFLSQDYYGNPNSGANMGEPYVYLNFTAVPGESIKSIQFLSTGAGGFETDNHSVLEEYIEPPGHGVPETASSLVLLSGALGLVFAFRLRWSIA
jgi:hypothetical protein